MSHFRLPFEVASPPFDEDSIPFEGDPESYVRRLAEGKAESLADAHKDKIIISADTLVFYNGRPFGKPKSRD